MMQPFAMCTLLIVIASLLMPVDAFIGVSFKLKMKNIPALGMRPSLHFTRQTSLYCETSDDIKTEEDSSSQDSPDGAIEDILLSNSTSIANETTAVDPKAEAIKALESKLRRQVDSLESQLRAERLQLSKVKDKVSESGKTGYFIVQAQVNEFLKRKDADQKIRVEANKKDFVQKMLPIVDSFRQAESLAPPTNDREIKMHNNFGSLLSGILTVFEKFGYTEFLPEVGETLDPIEHNVQDLIETIDQDGKVVEVLRVGLKSKDGDIVRRALVIGGKTVKIEQLTSSDEKTEDTGSIEPSGDEKDVTESAAE